MFTNQEKLIAKIHNEFDTAQERLLNEAKEIINGTSKLFSDKAERLERIGFINTETVVKHKKNKDVLIKNKAQAELIEYYKQNYPFQKFITETELDRICDKYKLIYAPISNYIKDVPEKNISEIESCTDLNQKDCIETTYKVIKTNNEADFLKLLNHLGKNTPEFTNTEVLEIAKNNGRRGALDWIFDQSTYMVFHDIKEKLKLRFSIEKYETIYKQGLFIAAPISNFNLEGLKKHKKFGFLQISVTEIKDPVVFRYCRGGIQVLSKWGLEGQDESLTNEKLN